MATKKNMPAALGSVFALALALFLAGCGEANDHAPPLAAINVTPPGPHPLVQGGEGVSLVAARMPSAARDGIVWETEYTSGREYLEFSATNGPWLTVTGLRETSAPVRVRARSGGVPSDWVYFTVGSHRVFPHWPQHVVAGEGGAYLKAPTGFGGGVVWEIHDGDGQYVAVSPATGPSTTVAGLRARGTPARVRAVSGGMRSDWVYIAVGDEPLLRLYGQTWERLVADQGDVLEFSGDRQVLGAGLQGTISGGMLDFSLNNPRPVYLKDIKAVLDGFSLNLGYPVLRFGLWNDVAIKSEGDADVWAAWLSLGTADGEPLDRSLDLGDRANSYVLFIYVSRDVAIVAEGARTVEYREPGYLQGGFNDMWDPGYFRQRDWEDFTLELEAGWNAVRFAGANVMYYCYDGKEKQRYYGTWTVSLGDSDYAQWMLTDASDREIDTPGQ